MRRWFILVLIPFAAHAMSLHEALSLCEESPQAKIAAKEVEIAGSGLEIAQRVLPENPQINPYYTHNADSKNTYGISLDQRVEIAGQRTYRMQASKADIEAKKAQYAWMLRKLHRDVRALFLDAWYMHQKIVLLDSLMQEERSMQNYLQKRVDAGEVPPDLLTSVLMEVADHQTQKMALESALQNSRGRLCVLLGTDIDAVETNFARNFSLPRLDAYVKKLSTHPKLKMSGNRINQARVQMEQLRRSRYLSDFDLNLLGEKDAGEYKYGIGVTIPLPLFNTKEPETASAMTELSRRAAMKENLQITLHAKLDRLYRNAAARLQTISLYETGIMPSLEGYLNRLSARYKAGEIAFADYENGFERHLKSRFNLLENQVTFLKTQNDITLLTGESYE